MISRTLRTAYRLKPPLSPTPVEPSTAMSRVTARLPAELPAAGNALPRRPGCALEWRVGPHTRVALGPGLLALTDLTDAGHKSQIEVRQCSWLVAPVFTNASAWAHATMPDKTPRTANRADTKPLRQLPPRADAWTVRVLKAPDIDGDQRSDYHHQ